MLSSTWLEGRGVVTLMQVKRGWRAEILVSKGWDRDPVMEPWDPVMELEGRRGGRTQEGKMTWSRAPLPLR